MPKQPKPNKLAVARYKRARDKLSKKLIASGTKGANKYMHNYAKLQLNNRRLEKLGAPDIIFTSLTAHFEWLNLNTDILSNVAVRGEAAVFATRAEDVKRLALLEQRKNAAEEKVQDYFGAIAKEVLTPEEHRQLQQDLQKLDDEED